MIDDIENNLEENMYDNQLLVSFELICLLKWMLENEDEKLSKIIKKAMESGLQEEINKKAFMSKEEMLFSIQPVLFDFFDMLECMLAESIGQNAIRKVIEKNLMPSIDHIDSSVCDNETVRFCIEKTALKLDREEEKELLKNYSKKNTKNSKESSKESINSKKLGTLEKTKNSLNSLKGQESKITAAKLAIEEDLENDKNSDTSQEKAKKILMTELLKRWKPKEKNIIN